MRLRSGPSPLTPRRSWPSGKPLLACYHGLDSAGSTDIGTSTLQMDRLLGSRLPLGLGFLWQGSWAGMDNVQNQFGPYVGIRSNVIVSTPLAMPGTTLAQVASGAFNSYFINVATKLRDLGFPAAIVRPGWEFNGDWNAWSARGFEPDFIGSFRQCVGSFRSVSGTNFKVLWNPDKKEGRWAKSTYADPPDCYPGDDVVDFIGIDAYNGWTNGVNAPTKNANGTGGAVAAGDTPWPIPTQVARWNNELVGVLGTTNIGTAKPFCLAWCLDFATQHGKPIIIPEWGTGFDEARAGENCGDDGYYVQQMGAWLNAHAYAHGYWDCSTRILTGPDRYYRANMTVYDSLTADALAAKPNALASFIAAFGT